MELRAADAVFNGKILHGLHVESDSGDLRQFRLQAADDVGSADLALVERLQIELDTAAVERDIRSIDADEGGKTLHGRVLQNHFSQRLLQLRHLGKRNRLRRFGNSLDNAGILDREKTLRNDDVEINGQGQSGEGHKKRDDAMAKNYLQGPAVTAYGFVEGSLGDSIEAPASFFRHVLQQPGGHHGAERQRHHGGNQDGDAQSDRKLPEEAAHNFAHE